MTDHDPKLDDLLNIIQDDPQHLRTMALRSLLAVALGVASLAAMRLLDPGPFVWMLACLLVAFILLAALVILAIVWYRQRRLEKWLLTHRK